MNRYALLLSCLLTVGPYPGFFCAIQLGFVPGKLNH